jgi:Zn-dependent protease
VIALFRVRGIPIRLDAGWLIVYGLIAWSLASGYFPYVVPDRSTGAYWTSGLLAATLLFSSVLLHELAHALVARAFRVGVAGITLHVFGGASELETEPPHPRAEALIAIVGPLTSLAVGTVVLALRQLAGSEPWLSALLGYLGVVNLAVGFFNLAPGFPLDGGRMLRALLWWWSGRYEWSTRVASVAGAAFALGVVALGLYRVFAGQTLGGVWFILLGAFLFEAARSSYQLARLQVVLAGVRAETVMAESPAMLPATATLESALVTAARGANRPAIPVVDGGRFVGFARAADLERRRGRAGTVAEAMIPFADDLIVTPDDSAWLALARLSHNRASTVAVVDDGRVVGVITQDELARVIADESARRLDRAA